MNVGTRSSHPSGVHMLSSPCSTRCSGTWDCTKMTARSGSNPAASQSSTISCVSLVMVPTSSPPESVVSAWTSATM